MPSRFRRQRRRLFTADATSSATLHFFLYDSDARRFRQLEIHSRPLQASSPSIILFVRLHVCSLSLYSVLYLLVAVIVSIIISPLPALRLFLPLCPWPCYRSRRDRRNPQRKAVKTAVGSAVKFA